MATSRTPPTTKPIAVPASARSAVAPVDAAFVRSTESVPSTTQKPCWTLPTSATATAAASATAPRRLLMNQTERTLACVWAAASDARHAAGGPHGRGRSRVPPPAPGLQPRRVDHSRRDQGLGGDREHRDRDRVGVEGECAPSPGNHRECSAADRSRLQLRPGSARAGPRPDARPRPRAETRRRAAPRRWLEIRRRAPEDASVRSARSRIASALSAAHHSSSSTQLARAWSAAARPVGRYGVAVKRASRSCFKASVAARCSSPAVPLSAASSWSARAAATFEAARRSASSSSRGESTSTAAVPATEASHHPASRSGTMAIVPNEAAGRT